MKNIKYIYTAFKNNFISSICFSILYYIISHDFHKLIEADKHLVLTSLVNVQIP
jgi:hypothetical protein